MRSKVACDLWWPESMLQFDPTEFCEVYVNVPI
jgi:hypothetical protein